MRAFVPFTILLNSRAEDSDAGYDRDDDWKPKVGTDIIQIIYFKAFEKLNTIYFATL